MHAISFIYIHLYINTCINSINRHAYIPTCLPTYTHTYMHTYIHTHTYMLTYIRTYIEKRPIYKHLHHYIYLLVKSSQLLIRNTEGNLMRLSSSRSRYPSLLCFVKNILLLSRLSFSFDVFSILLGGKLLILFFD